ncbi:hypothetical protein Poli38472_005649 [Pythium oligandrum]|uniref:ABC-type xenobiotic transporter n=1 Tax=Pythium oligandrum TaxID=41045 RepID=A0A8K1FHR4_PYTOL|nr:hypothetical protein Poli38472_005649 [Pythium oligandrum]|eukprot:TMW63031.1 hypothetical protein Poli38472_005649 [Pythium oligandrum]
MDGVYCVDARGTPLPERWNCVQMLVTQGVSLALLVVCMHRVLVLVGRMTPVMKEEGRRGWRWKAIFYMRFVLTLALVAVSASIVGVAFEVPSTAALVMSSAISTTYGFFYATALWLEWTRRVRVSFITESFFIVVAFMEALLFHVWSVVVDSPHMHTIAALVITRLGLLGTLAFTAKMVCATTPPASAMRGNASPFDRASWLSRISYYWVSRIIQLSQHRRLEIADIPELPAQDSTSHAAQRFKVALGEELGETNPSFLRVLRKLYGREVLGFALWSTVNKFIGLGSPLLIKLFLDWADEPSPRLSTGYTLAFAMIIRSIAASVSGTQYSLAWQRFDIRVRAGIISAIYDRSLGLSSSAKHRYGLGRITNLISVDLGRLVRMPGTVFDMFLIPAEIVFALLLLAHEVSYAFVGGLAVLAVMLPIQTALGGKIQTVTKKMLEYRDQRVDMTAECLKSMRTIKLLGWSEVFFQKIDGFRQLEMGRLSVRKYLDALCVFFWASTPVIVQTSVFAIVIYTGHDLTAANAFTAVSLLDRLIYPMNYFPWIINGFLEARVSALRIREYLFPSHHSDEFTSLMLLPPLKTEEKKKLNGEKRFNVEAYDCSFKWGVDEIESSDDVETPLMAATQSKAFELHLTRLELKADVTYLVCGAVGSGKSSLLLSLLGEMPRKSGRVGTLRPRVSYAPQTPWLFRGTVHENITLCENDQSVEFDLALYQQVLQVCELEQDLKARKNYDMTVVAENGSNFSGGQKVRINLARALYQRTMLYLLDDPLSGLDAATAQRVLHNLFKSTGKRIFPEGASVVVATHAIQFIESFPSNVTVLVMDNGNVVEQGNYDELKTMQPSGRFMALLASARSTVSVDAEKATESSNSSALDVTEENTSKEDEDEKKSSKDEEEHRESGTVNLHVWKLYARAIGWAVSLAIMVAVVIMQASRNGLDWWIAFYTNAHSVTPHYFVNVLLWITFVNCVSVFFRSFLFAYGGLRAAKSVYRVLVTKIFGAQLRFFDATPVGRILNRLSGDTYSVDESLPFILNIFLKDFADVVGSLVIIFYGNKYVLLLLVPLSVIYFRLQDSYRPTSRHVERLDSAAQSPILSMFTETLEGLYVIRGLRLQQQYRDMYERFLNLSQRMSFLGANAGSWFGIRLDFLGVGVTSFVAIFAVAQFQWTGRVHPGVLGLTLTYALPIVSKLNTILGSFVDTERQMIAVERVKEYSDLSPEEQTTVLTKGADLPSWPTHGAIKMSNLSVEYSSGESSLQVVKALKNVTCSVEAGTKIGICGRTGAGKSSFMHALFRAVPMSSGSSISIDGVAIQDVSLSVLRSRLTYIPQDVVLFSGSVRSNLDPEGRASDHELWRCLTRCGLDVVVSRLADGLDAAVASGEATFSKGQAQLLCIARALLRRSKVLCIDEATSSIDHVTEEIVSKTLHEDFEDATVIIIAHRIKTIMGCDRIMVLQDGKVAESGSPATLMQDSSSLFYGLASQGETI